MRTKLFSSNDAFVCELTEHSDVRGKLCFAELGKDLPFAAQRLFWIYGVPSNTQRGGHAHKNDHQFLICFHGEISVEVIHNQEKCVIHLDSPNRGLYLPPLTWNNLINFSANSILGVLSSNRFNPDDYIDNLADYSTYF